MKIIFFARRFYPDIGGVEKHVLQLSKKLIEKGHTITVISEKNDTSATSFTYKGITVYKISVGNDDKLKKFRIWKSLWQIRRIVASADIIHCHDVFFWYLPFRFLFPFKPVYTTFHGYEGFPIRLKDKLIRKISELLSFGNICIGDFIKKWYGTKPTFVSYGAVDSNKKATVATNMLGASALFFGRLDDQTGITTYLDAYTIIKQKIKNFNLLVIGDGKCKIPHTIKHLSFQRNPEKYFREYHFAFLSRYLSILEAFAAKRLVFAVYDNKIKEDYLRLAPYANFIIIEKDAKAIAEKVLYFLNHPDEEKKMVEEAYKWVKKQTWDEMALLYLALWKTKK